VKHSLRLSAGNQYLGILRAGWSISPTKH